MTDELALADIRERMEEFRTQARQVHGVVKTAPTIKMALVAPLIDALGYRPFNPFEVVPDYSHENGGRVDYAVKTDDQVRILVTLASAPDDLTTDRARLLAQAVQSAGATCAILTSGVDIRVHGTTESGTFDPESIFSINLLEDGDLTPLLHLSKIAFDVPTLIEKARRHRLADALSVMIDTELSAPSAEFLSFASSRLQGNPSQDAVADAAAILSARRSAPDAAPEEEEDDGKRRVTPEEELAFRVVQAIAAQVVDPNRVFMRVNDTYTAVILDDTHHRTIARLHYNFRTKYVGTMAARSETRHAITSAMDIYAHADAIRAAVLEVQSRPSPRSGRGSESESESDVETSNDADDTRGDGTQEA